MLFAGQSLTPVEDSYHFNIQEALVKKYLLLQLPCFEADYPPVISLKKLTLNSTVVENTFGKLNSKSETVLVNFSVILSIDITSSQRLFPQRPLMALLLAMIVADDDSDDNSGVSYNELLVILTE